MAEQVTQPPENLSLAPRQSIDPDQAHFALVRPLALRVSTMAWIASPCSPFHHGGRDGHKTSDGRISFGGHWRDESEWPLNAPYRLPYYLHSNGVLSIEKPSKRTSEQLRVRPTPSCSTIGGNIAAHYGRCRTTTRSSVPVIQDLIENKDLTINAAAPTLELRRHAPAVR